MVTVSPAFTDESHASRLERFADLSARVLRGFHAELPQVTERWGVDPTRVLERLAADGEAAGSLDRRLLSAFGLFRDRHTLPSLDERADVFRLPFSVCAVAEGGRLRVVVERAEAGEVPAWMTPGTELTHWNGEPIRGAALRCGSHQRARHAAAREALGLRALTHRTTGSVPRPRADWVDVTGVDSRCGSVREQRFDWRASGVAVPPREVTLSTTHASALRDDAVRDDALSKDALHDDALQDDPFSEAGASSGLSHRCFRLRVEGSSVGVFRLHELICDGALSALDELLQRPLDVLVVDLRGNAGGEVEAADRIVQRLAGGPPEPCLFQFRDSQSVRRMLNRHSAWREWSEPSSELSSGGWLNARSITEPTSLDDGEGFSGALVVVVDALTYSAAEILAGRLRERAGAVLVGEQAVTGGGLANAWGYSALQSLHPTQQLRLDASERYRDEDGAGAREEALARWATHRGFVRSAGYSEPDSGLWLLHRPESGASGGEVAVEWRPDCDDEHLAVFDRDAPVLPEMPFGFGLQLAIRRALVGGTEHSCDGAPVPALVPDAQLRRRRLDVVRGDADFYRRCLRSARRQRVAAPRSQRPPSGDHSGESR